MDRLGIFFTIVYPVVGLSLARLMWLKNHRCDEALGHTGAIIFLATNAWWASSTKDQVIGMVTMYAFAHLIFLLWRTIDAGVWERLVKFLVAMFNSES